jgi:hypothetical protein
MAKNRDLKFPKTLSGTWQRSPGCTSGRAIVALVDRVELKCDGMGVSIKLPIADPEKSRAQLSDAVAITRSFPMQLKRRGVEFAWTVPITRFSLSPRNDASTGIGSQ